MTRRRHEARAEACSEEEAQQHGSLLLVLAVARLRRRPLRHELCELGFVRLFHCLGALRAVVRGRLESAAPRALAVDAREHRFCRSTRARNCDCCCPQRDASVQAERGSAGGDQQYVRKRTNLARRLAAAMLAVCCPPLRAIEQVLTLNGSQNKQIACVDTLAFTAAAAESLLQRVVGGIAGIHS